MNKYYVYIHIKETDGSPFYVGKGKDKRAYRTINRSKHWHNIVNKYGYDIIIIEDNLDCETAFNLERYWIKRIGRKDLGLGTLVNFTYGGEGADGYKHTPESKSKMSNFHKGKVLTKEHREKIASYKSRSKLVLNLETGIYYISAKEVSELIGCAHSTMRNKLNGGKRNDTNFIYV
jgi:hypothetical protein